MADRITRFNAASTTSGAPSGTVSAMAKKAAKKVAAKKVAKKPAKAPVKKPAKAGTKTPAKTPAKAPVKKPVTPTPKAPEVKATRASDALAEMFARWNMGGLSKWISDSIKAGKTDAEISVGIYDQPEYKQRFPAMESLRGKPGGAITEAEYLSLENGYKSVLRYYGLEDSMYDNPDDFASLISNGVSAREVEERMGLAKRLVESYTADPNIRVALRANFPFVTDRDLMIYALDPQKKGRDHIEKLSRQAIVSGSAVTSGLTLSQRYASSLANDSMIRGMTDESGQLNEDRVRETLASASAFSDKQRRLAAMDGESFTDEDAVDIAVKRDTKKALASRRRSLREQARFGGSSGIASGSLSSPGL